MIADFGHILDEQGSNGLVTCGFDEKRLHSYHLCLTVSLS